MLIRLTQIMRGWANYFKHAVAKHVFDRLDAFVWWRLIRVLRERHRWSWSDVRRRFTTPTRRWRPIAADGVELFRIASVTVSRYRYRRPRSPAHGSLRTPSDGRNRGEPVALKDARRVRREVRRNGPGATPAPRSGPTQRTILSPASPDLGDVWSTQLTCRARLLLARASRSFHGMCARTQSREHSRVSICGSASRIAVETLLCEVNRANQPCMTGLSPVNRVR